MAAAPTRARRLCWLLCAAVAMLLGLDGATARPDPRGTLDDQVTRLLDADRIAEAVDLLRKHTATQPGDRIALAQLGEIERRRCNLDGARRVYDRMLVRDLLDPLAHAGHAELHLLVADAQEALESAAMALSTPRGRRCGPAWRAKAMALIDLGRYKPALAAARRGVQVAPDDVLVAEAYARAAFRVGDMPEAGRAYRRATELDPLTEEGNLRLGSGFGPLTDGRPWTYAEFRKRFAAGVTAWEDGRLTEATVLFRELVAAKPDNFKFRLGLGLVRRATRRYHELAFGGSVGDAYLKLPSYDAPELARYILNWKDLPEWAKDVVRISVAPAHKWLDELVKHNGTHEILRLTDTLDDAPTRRSLRTVQTFDGRWYAHIRGVGGAAAATGIEKLKGATEFSFNTFAHEFAHQLLRQAFPRRHLVRVNQLYVKARNEGRCLDYYAASNVDEYFAQGYEALVSLRKRGCLRDTARHTRAELIERDPALFKFLIEVLDLSHETPDAMRPFQSALGED